MRIPKTQVVLVCGGAAKSKNVKDQPESYFKVYSNMGSNTAHTIFMKCFETKTFDISQCEFQKPRSH